MKGRSKAIVILTILFGYVLLQFIWWEILLVRQTGTIINERQKLAELSITDHDTLQSEIETLHKKKTTQTIMIVSEGTVFLLLLLFGLHKIKQAQDREMALTSQQNNFFLSVTHELKTPIAATKLQLQTLQKQKLEKATQDQLITNALQENERLNSLIDNVLLASRLGSGEMTLKKERLDLTQYTADIINRYYRQAVEKNSLVLLPSPQLFVSVDAHAYTSIVTNLVENALKYGGSEAPVKVGLAGEKKRIHLSVSDEGPGISNKEKKKIFERFYRTGNEETRSSRGTGLGLYIVSNLVHKHGGLIRVVDNNPKGSRFEITFNV
jgi:two-component system sensor histidine kinase CiaH